ncbi:Long-chain-fatty-acid--CoA ligase [Variovorax sp. SRS16]|uniref:AMP-binding protein n=1 Tax=Variovorax sp. SRS16 TaxID=282217 RepID=UPI001317BB40|nr:AMP-binding protein [Variovorax sp. SRS16]VTU14443.1 Long-chain-fatty-acid--CoA ligase [Variovorax sp. SRS16]
MIDRHLHDSATYSDLVELALQQNPDAPALVQDGRSLSYAALRTAVHQMQDRLLSAGLARTDGIAQLSSNRIDAVIVQLASFALGLRYTPLHPMGSVDDHAYILEDAEVSALVVEPAQFGEHARQLLSRATSLRHVFSHGASDFATDIFSLPMTGAPAKSKAKSHPEDVVALLYTGGTSGRSKGVTLTNRSMVMNVLLTLSGWEWPADIRFLCSTPITHATGCMLVPILSRGGTIHLHAGFDARKFLATVARDRINSTFLVPTMIYLLIEAQRTAPVDTSALETVIYGGSPISPARLAEAIALFGPVFMQIYSQSEAPNCATVLRKKEHQGGVAGRHASCGRPLPGITVALLDDDHHPVKRGDIGEICFRGPSIMQGYWNKPEETAETLRGGWLHTGDLAFEDGEGFLHIVDRRKEMIVSGGFNVYPREIEDVITAHPAISSAAVIGVPDGKWGEAVKAMIVLREGATVTAGEIMHWVREKKGAVATPKSVDFLDALPLTALGKPDKKTLRARYWAGQQRQVS